MNLERLVIIEPAPGSLLAQQLSDLQALQAQSRAAEQELAQLRDQRMGAGQRLRHAARTLAAAETLDELQDAAEILDAAFKQQLQVCQPLAEALQTASDSFYRNYIAFLQANQAAAEARRLGGR
jgi:hypothetical protein